MKLLHLSLLILAFFSCSRNEDAVIVNNPYLPNYTFDTGNLINTNLPQFADLKFPGSSVIILDKAVGINGVVVFNAGGTFNAFELTDPNHNIENCSILQVEGSTASCICNDGNSYDIISGAMQEGTNGQYTLKRYFVEANNSIIRVYNN